MVMENNNNHPIEYFLFSDSAAEFLKLIGQKVKQWFQLEHEQVLINSLVPICYCFYSNGSHTGTCTADAQKNKQTKTPRLMINGF